MIPDKHTYRQTITNKLRQDIIDVAKGTFLEIGCDVGYTTESVIDHFDKIVAVDILEEKIKTAQKRLKNNKIVFMQCTASEIPDDVYNVVLIDANHAYEHVLNDFENIYKHNLCHDYKVFFHDFGLKAGGVKQAIEKIIVDYGLKYQTCGEEKNWNPLGGSVIDWEAVVIDVNRT